MLPSFGQYPRKHQKKRFCMLAMQHCRLLCLVRPFSWRVPTPQMESSDVPKQKNLSQNIFFVIVEAH
jgi:hypothetical protein